ncbi:MAG TPA: hypothetical protein VF748_14725 [Candidatus Acidoferrum sp.]
MRTVVERKLSGERSTPDPASPIPTHGPLRARYLHLLGTPGCLCRFSLLQATVYIFIGRLRPFSIRVFGAATPRGYYAFASITDLQLTRHVRVTFHRFYVHLGHTIVNMDK